MPEYAYCYAEVTIRFLAAVTTASAHCTLPTEEWPGWAGLHGLVMYQDGMTTNGHPSQY